MKVGALALQGDFREHLAMLTALGVEGVEVRTPEELATVAAILIFVGAIRLRPEPLPAEAG